MHDDAYISGHSENKGKGMVIDIAPLNDAL